MSRWCPACDGQADRFDAGPDGRPDARCPRCQALERHRFLAVVLRRLAPAVDSARRVLEIAPQRQIRHLLVARVGRRYVGVDLAGDLPVDALADATRLPFPAATFDLVVAYHVLEHVADDRAAMAELHRVLRHGGVAIVQVPRRHGVATDEDPDAPEAQRVARFGQADHVRYYGDDLEERLRGAGLHELVFAPRDVLDPAEVERCGLVADEEVWACFRGPVARRDGDDPLTVVLRTCLALERRAADRFHRDLVITLDRARGAERDAQRLRAELERLRGDPLVRAARRLRRVLPRGG